METLALFVDGKLMALLTDADLDPETGNYDLTVSLSWPATIPDGQVGEAMFCLVDKANPETILRTVKRFENPHIHTLGSPVKLRLTV